MRQPESQSLFDLLDDSQKEGLRAIRGRDDSTGKESLDCSLCDQLIEILESWLMDDEQKQHLRSNPYDKFFLLAASTLISTGGFEKYNPAVNVSSNFIASPISSPGSTKPVWPALEIENEAQTEIIELIAKGFFAADGLAAEIPPRVLYDGKHEVNIQLLAACLRLAMGFNLTAPGTLNHLREMLPQNAVDACNLRHMQDPGFNPVIGIEFSPDLDRITFRDNGIGMSKQWIEKYFLNMSSAA